MLTPRGPHIVAGPRRKSIMSKIIRLVLSVCLGGYTLLLPANAEPIVTAHGLDDHDIRLIAPSDGQFNQIISSLIAPGTVPAETQAMLPYSVVLHNNTDRPIVVYSTQYTFTDAAGVVSTQPGS